MHDDVKLYFENEIVKNHKQTLDLDHGRIEKREYFLETEIDWLYGKENWKNLRGIGMVRSKVTIGEKTTCEERYYITSLTDVKKFAESVRGHWGIENSLHWCLDTVFNEDKCRINKDHTGENLAIIRHIAINLLRKDPTKMSLKSKRFRCSYDENYLFRLFLSGF